MVDEFRRFEHLELEAHEPDLLSVARELGCKPEDLVEARRELERGEP